MESPARSYVGGAGVAGGWAHLDPTTQMLKRANSSMSLASLGSKVGVLSLGHRAHGLGFGVWG